MSGITTSFFLIFAGAAVLASLALYTRQPLIIAYIVLGAVIGPYGVEWVTDLKLLADIADVGILFLLFLLGLDMQPRALIDTIQKSTVVALLSSLAFAAMGIGIASLFGFTLVESLVIGAAMMFSSTIIGIKLLPTTILHHRHTGEVIISVLLFQDLIAILVMLGLQGLESADLQPVNLLLPLLALPFLIAIAFVLDRLVLLKLFSRMDKVQEYIFLLTLAWCLGIAHLGHTIGLSYEIGAFLAGVVFASHPIALVIAERLKPLRDFFLVLFFFALGASLDLEVIGRVAIPAMVLALVFLAMKPVVFRYALGQVAESPRLAWETGWRLGQMSEFSLLIAFLAVDVPGIGADTISLIQVSTVLTFIGSSSVIVLRFPTPVAVSDRLRRD